MKRSGERSPRATARLAGACDFLEGLTSSTGQVLVPGMVLVAGDAAATVTNILTHELVFRLGIAAGVVAVASHVAWTVLFYELFRPVNRTVARLAACVGLVGITVQAFSLVLQLAPLVILQPGSSLSAFSADQLRALVLLMLNLRLQTFNLYIALFGVWCVMTGCLIVRSTFMPRVIGVLEVVSGLCWLTFVWPPLGTALFPWTGALAAPGEFSVQLWLLLVGVNVQRWNEQASAARTSAPAEALALLGS